MDIQNEILVDLLQVVDKAMAAHMKKILEKHQVLPFTVMMASMIFKNPGITVSELSRATNLAKSHISTTVENLAQKGWVRKEDDPEDHRIVRIFLTEDAISYYQTIREDIRQYLFSVVSQLSPDRVEGLIDGLQDLKLALKENSHGFI